MKLKNVGNKNNIYAIRQANGSLTSKSASNKSSRTKIATNIAIATGIGGTVIAVIKRKSIKASVFNILASKKVKLILDPIAKFMDNWWAKPDPKRYYKEFTEIKKGKYYRGIRPVSFKRYKICLKNPDYLHSKDISRFQKFKDNNIKTIIDLSRSTKQVKAKETELAGQFGIKYVNIPLTGLRSPEPKEIVAFFKTIKDSPGGVYVHCLDGKDRTGVMSALYRVVKDKMDWKDAYKEMKKFKYSEEKLPKLKDFLQEFAEAEKYKGLRSTLSEMFINK